MKSDIFDFVEKEDVPFAIEKSSGDIFRMDARDPEKWFEIEDSDSRCRIRLKWSQTSARCGRKSQPQTLPPVSDKKNTAV